MELRSATTLRCYDSETDLATPDTVATPEPSPLLMTATGLSLVLAAAFRLSALPALSS